MRSVLRQLVVGVLCCVVSASPLAAQNPAQGGEELVLTLFPATVGSPVLQHRLLPAEYELRDGNAATVLLRLSWEQTQFLTNDVPLFYEHLDIPLLEIDAIIAAGAGLRPRMYAEIRRAAYRRSAEWEYPIDESAGVLITAPSIEDARGTQHNAIKLRVKVGEG